MKKNRLKKILITILLIIGIISVAFNIFIIKNRNSSEKLLSENIEQQIEKVSELSTVKYNYTDVISYEDVKQLSGFDIPFTNKSFIVKYSGYLKAGVDTREIEVESVGKDKILVTIPEAEILENVINEEDVTFFDERDGLFNKLDYTELYDILIDAKKKTENEVIENGILEEANLNTEDILRLFLIDLGYNDIVIETKELK